MPRSAILTELDRVRQLGLDAEARLRKLEERLAAQDTKMQELLQEKARLQAERGALRAE
jgi:uncharacterized coiled-coil protein SlyX